MKDKEFTEKFITFSVPVRIDKKGKGITKTIYLKDSARFMASSISNLVNNHAEGIYKTKCIYAHNDIKNVKFVELNTKIVENTNSKDDLIEYKCCNKNCKKSFMKT